LAHFNRFVATTVGRDKVLRTLQYFSRFLAWYLYRTNNPQATVAIFESVKKTFSTTRKAMRLGKFVEHFKAAAVALDSKTLDPVLKYLAVGRQLGYGVYLSCDAITYVDAAGIRKFESAAAYNRVAYRAWAFGLACNIAAAFYTLHGLQNAAKKHLNSADAEKAVELKKLEKEKTATQLQLLSDVCDIASPSSSLGWVTLDDGVIGLTGTVSSLIGLRSAWRKTA